MGDELNCENKCALFFEELHFSEKDFLEKAPVSAETLKQICIDKNKFANHHSNIIYIAR